MLCFATTDKQMTTQNEESANIFEVVIAGDLEAVNIYLTKAEVDVNARNPLGYTLLMIAACYGNTNIVRELLDANADIEALSTPGISHLDEEGSVVHTNGSRTALMYACGFGKVETVALLLERGARANDPENLTLGLAIESSYIEVVQMILSAGVDVNLSNCNGYTALMNAATTDQPDIVQLLLDYGADRHMRDVRNYTALDFAHDGEDCEETIAILQE